MTHGGNGGNPYPLLSTEHEALVMRQISRTNFPIVDGALLSHPLSFCFCNRSQVSLWGHLIGVMEATYETIILIDSIHYSDPINTTFQTTELIGHREPNMGLCILMSSVVAHIDSRYVLKPNFCALKGYIFSTIQMKQRMRLRPPWRKK